MGTFSNNFDLRMDRQKNHHQSLIEKIKKGSSFIKMSSVDGLSYDEVKHHSNA